MDEELEKLIDLTYARFRDEFEKQIMKDEIYRFMNDYLAVNPK